MKLLLRIDNSSRYTEPRVVDADADFEIRHNVEGATQQHSDWARFLGEGKPGDTYTYARAQTSLDYMASVPGEPRPQENGPEWKAAVRTTYIMLGRNWSTP